MPLDDLYAFVLGYDDGNGLVQFLAEPVGRPVPGADPFAQHGLRLLTFRIERMGHHPYAVEISGNDAAKTEQFLTLGDHHRAVYRRQGRDEVGHVEDRLVQQGYVLVLAVNVILPADLFAGFVGIAVYLGHGVHDAQRQGLKALPRLVFQELVLDRHVLVLFQHQIGDLRRKVDQQPAVIRVPYHAYDAANRLLPDVAAEFRVQIRPGCPRAGPRLLMHGPGFRMHRDKTLRDPFGIEDIEGRAVYLAGI